jgi:hypothetical protein
MEPAGPSPSVAGEYFDDETCRLEPIEDPLARDCHPCLRNGVLPMSAEWTWESWLRGRNLNPPFGL